MALATKCPHCSTTFRVASDQLKLRGGIVRCGACHEVFDGNASLIDQPDQAPKEAPMPPAFLMRKKPPADDAAPASLAQSATPAASAVGQEQQGSLALDLDSGADPATPPPQSQPESQPQSQPELELESEPEPDPEPEAEPEPEPKPEPKPEPELDAEPEPAPPAAPLAAPAAPDAPAVTVDFDLNLEPPVESSLDFDLNLNELDLDLTAPPTTSLLPSNAPPKSFVLAEPDFEEPAVAPVRSFAEEALQELASKGVLETVPETAAPFEPAAQFELDAIPEAAPLPPAAAMVYVPFELDETAYALAAAASPEPVEEPDTDPEFSFDSEPETQAEIDIDAVAEADSAPAPEPQPSAVAEEQEEPEFVLRARAQERAARTRRIVMAGASLVLALALAAQGVTTFRNVLAARYPQLLPALAAACVHLRCRIELPMQIETLSIESGELQTIGGDTFSLNTSLRNQGVLAQAWPNIELTLTDNNDKALLRRVLAPADYLPKDTPTAKGFAARSEQPVKLYFSVKQIKASGYRIAVFYP